MAEEKRLDGDMKTDQAASSSFHSAVVDSEKEAVKRNKQEHTSRSKDESTNTVSFYKLFSFSDSTDYLLMLVGTISAVGNGLSLPLMTIIFGTLVDSFGDSGNNKQVLPKVSKVCSYQINIVTLLC